MNENPGIYRAKKISLQMTKSKNKGTPAMSVTFEVRDENRIPMQRTMDLWLGPKSLKRTMDWLDEHGYNGDAAEPDLSVEEFDVECKLEEDDKGQLRPKWQIPFTGSGNLPAGTADTSAFNREWRARKLEKPPGRQASEQEGGAGPIPF